MSECKQNDILVLAALLHDVGKFAQRAGAAKSVNMEQEYCPSDENGKPSRTHVLYTDAFIESEALPLPLELEGKRSGLARMAAAHHRPSNDSLEEMCLMRADRLSSSSDRMAGKNEGDYKTARMESVFAKIALPGGTAGQDGSFRKLCYALRPLDDPGEPPIFPVSLEDARKTTYADLYAQFLQALHSLPLNMGIRHYTQSLATVLERFTWCIPSSTYLTDADISLYDHSTTTAAIAQALYACRQNGMAEHQEKLLLFGGDLSGIQKFIFGEDETSSKGAAKLLRARSLMLQMLTRSVWLTLLEQAELSSVARIMDAGGRFILLLPATSRMKKLVETLQTEVQQDMLDKYQGVLRMNFAVMELEADELERERFRKCYEAFNDQLEKTKLQPFAGLFQNGRSALLPMARELYAEYGECETCCRQPADSTSEEDGRLCHTCANLIKQVGRRLPEATHLVLRKQGEGFPLFGGLRLFLSAKEPDAGDRDALDILNIKNRNAFSAAPVAGYVPLITTEDLERWREGKLLIKGEDGVERYAGDDESFTPGDPKTFAMLADESRIPTDTGSYRSVPYLAACKADVDNLGLLFGAGFGTGKESKFSISRFAMLSRMMNHFFSAYLPECIRVNFPNIYVLFAGGDDLFVLGPWADIIYFAKRLRGDFGRFSGEHPDVTLSAGLPLFKPRLPVRKMREDAEEALEYSKGYHSQDGQKTKDAVRLFGVTCSFEDFPERIAFGEQLEQLCLDGKISQGFVRRLLVYSREARAFLREGQIHRGLYISHMAYDITRNCEEKGKLLHNDPDLNMLRKLAHDPDFPDMEMDISLALYRTRMS